MALAVAWAVVMCVCSWGRGVVVVVVGCLNVCGGVVGDVCVARGLRCLVSLASGWVVLCVLLFGRGDRGGGGDVALGSCGCGGVEDAGEGGPSGRCLG